MHTIAGGCFARTAGTVLVALLLPLAAAAVRAETVDCSSVSDIGERMKCKHGRMLDEQSRFIGNLETNFAGVLPAGHGNFERLKNANARAKRAHGRMTGEKFKSIGKKHPKDKKKEAPPESVTAPAGDEEDDDPDLEYLAEVEESYDEVTASLGTANELMEGNGEEIQSLTKPVLAASVPLALDAATSSFGPAEACQSSVDWVTFGRILTLTIMKQVSVGLKGIADIADKGCNQDAAGFNGASACIVLEAAAAVMALVVETTDGIFSLVQWGIDSAGQKCTSSLSADLQEAKYKLGLVVASSSTSNTQLSTLLLDLQDVQDRLASVAADLRALDVAVGALRTQVGDLNGSMNGRFDHVELLLNTPLGRRDAFPVK